jgi:3-isopropylmalate dehydrogenase
MMGEEANKISEKFPDIKLRKTNIDAQMMWLTKNPENYDVLVCGNLFGDIASDGFAGLVGGLGFACSANIGKDCAIFEPTHGSVMLDYLDEQDMAKRIRDAIAKVLAEGNVRTYDMLRMRGAPEVLSNGAASTTQMTDAIIKYL